MGRGRRARLLALLLPFHLAASAALAGASEPIPVEVSALPVAQFRIGSDQRRFGPVKFIGGLQLRSRSPEFGSISGFRFSGPQGEFVAVTDTGYWMFGRIDRNEDGRPVGFSNVRMHPIAGPSGEPARAKEEVDAESLHLDGDTAFVGFEHDHRIVRYRLAEGRAPAEQGRIDPLIPRHELRRNAGFEALARAPAGSPLEGALIVLTERSLDPDGNFFAAILEGPGKGIFKVRREGNFAITDAVFLPDGDLLVVERSFNMSEGVRMRLRRIPLDEIRAGATVDGEELFLADMRYQIDNMEAVDAWLDDDGHVRFAVLSDDNQSFLQRNLYLEFRFAEPALSDRNRENSTP